LFVGCLKATITTAARKLLGKYIWTRTICVLITVLKIISRKGFRTGSQTNHLLFPWPDKKVPHGSLVAAKFIFIIPGGVLFLNKKIFMFAK